MLDGVPAFFENVLDAVKLLANSRAVAFVVFDEFFCEELIDVSGKLLLFQLTAHCFACPSKILRCQVVLAAVAGAAHYLPPTSSLATIVPYVSARSRA